MKPVLSLKNAGFIYPDRTRAVCNLNLDIHAGEKMAILGSNGSGKTSLFLLLNGVNRVSEGSLVFKGKDFGYSKRELIELRRTVGIVFQDPDTQIFSPTVAEEIAFGLVNLKHEKALILKKIAEVSEKLHISHLLKKPTHLLSFGEKKRVCIASVMAMEPEVLVLDEPTSGLDPRESLGFMERLGEIHDSGRSIVLSTHNVNLAYDWADKILVLKDGRSLGFGTSVEVFRNEKVLEEAHLEKPFYEQMAIDLGLALPRDRKIDRDFFRSHLQPS